jgi:predicted ester cyclase
LRLRERYNLPENVTNAQPWEEPMPMDVKASQAMVRRRFAELDKKNFGILDELFVPSYVLNLPGMPKPLDLSTTKDFYAALYTAFPDLKHKIIEQISAGNKVVTRWEATGTHKAEFMGIAATRRKIALTGINIYRLTRGKLSASHVNWDMLSLMQQIGGVSQRLALPPKRAAK